MKRLIAFFVLIHAMWVLSRQLVATDATVKALSLESRLNELVGNYTAFAAGLQQMPHIDPTTGTTSAVISSLIAHGYMHS